MKAIICIALAVCLLAGFCAKLGDQVLLKKTFQQLRPPEMERVALKLAGVEVKPGNVIQLEMEALG